MKQRSKHPVLWAILSVVAIIIIILSFYIAELTAFPGNIQQTVYEKEIVTTGVKSTFHQGTMYRYPGFVPMLDVTGDYYEMGLQYGVLLRPEITSALVSYTKILEWNADEMGVPYPLLCALVKINARQMVKKLPPKFIDEMRGVADGSGTPLDTIQAISLFYDVSQSLGCTGVLMNGRDGIILHGTNQDTSSFGGEEMGKMTVVVRRNPTGHNSVINFDQPLYLGLSTGCNSKGLALFENSLHVRQPNKNGFPVLYLLRMALEDCSTMDEVQAMLNKYNIIGASSITWSSLHERIGQNTELLPSSWIINKMNGPMLWIFNRILNPELAKYQTTAPILTGHNFDREEVASTFPIKSEYTLDDVVNFLRLKNGPDGTDYAWCGTKWPICNWSGQRIILVDPQGDGFYLGTGTYYAALQNIFHVHNDFSKPPELFAEAIPIDPKVEAVAKIENKLISRSQKLGEFIQLAKQYSDDANLQFIVAHDSFLQGKWDLFVDYAQKAYEMKPSVAEYQLYAGFAAYKRSDFDGATQLLEPLNPAKLSLEQQEYRLSVLSQILANKDPQNSAQYDKDMRLILDKYNAQNYYKENVLPHIKALKPLK